MALIDDRLIPRPREVKALADKLIQAEDELSRLKAEWRAMFTTSPEQGGEDSRATLSDRILNLINSDETQTFSSGMVSQRLNANPNSVGPLLSRLVAEKKIRKVGHGDYRAHSQPTDWMVAEEKPAPNESPAALAS